MFVKTQVLGEEGRMQERKEKRMPAFRGRFKNRTPMVEPFFQPQPAETFFAILFLLLIAAIRFHFKKKGWEPTFAKVTARQAEF